MDRGQNVEEQSNNNGDPEVISAQRAREHLLKDSKDPKAKIATADPKPEKSRNAASAQEDSEKKPTTKHHESLPELSIKGTEKQPQYQIDTRLSGTLVCRDGGFLRSYSVQAGKVLDHKGKVVGSINDKNVATINDKQIKIGKAEASAFHSVGSDSNKLDVLPPNTAKQLNGTLSNGDNTEAISVIGGHLYDSKNKFLGILNDDGSVELPSNENTTGYQPINSLFNRFHFKGDINGKQREFFTSSDNTTGKIFLPTENGNRKECDVKVGMIIDKTTGEQLGFITPPELNAAGKLEGGLIYLKEGDKLKAQPLATFHGASFDLSPLSQTGVIGDTVKGKLQGICLGAETMADGRIRSDQGILNVNQSLIAEGQLKRQLEAELKATKEGDWLLSPSHISGTNEAQMNDLAARMQLSTRRADEFKRSLSNTRLTEADLAHLKQNVVDTQFQSTSSALAFRKQKLDSTESILEKLPKSAQIDPKDPEKTKPLQGTVKVPNEKGEIANWTIKDSTIYSTDGKEIGTIKANGLIELAGHTKENPKLSEMKSLTGAIWDLQYTDDAGKGQRLQWASLGDHIVSRANLSNEGYQEHLYAYEVDKVGKSENSRAIYDATGVRRKEFEHKLTNIFERGIAGQEDLKLLTNGGKSIRLEVVQSTGETKPELKSEPIDIPKLDEKIAQTVNGKLRIGNDIYQIRNGDLFKYQSGSNNTESIACGKLKAGYNVEIKGQGEFSLASENRVLLDMTMVAGECHQLIGLGRGHMTDNFGYVSGGLVDVQELNRQCEEHYKQAIAGNKEYFDKRPYLTGGLASYLMEGRDEQLQAFAHDIKKKINLLQKTIYENESTTSQAGRENNSLFIRGFKPGVLDGSQVDTSIMLVQSVLNATGTQAADTNYLAQQGAQVQRQVNDGVVMAAMTVATAGIGTGFSALANAQRIANLGRMGTVMLYAGEMGASATAGGLISSVGRASNESKFSDNFKGGMIEGGTMALGSLGGKFIGNSATVKEARELLKAYRAGAQLVPQQLKLASTLSKSLTGRMIEAGMSDAKILAARQIGRVLESAGSATGFHLAGQAREGQDLKLDGQSTLTGTAFMLAGHYIGHGIERFMKTQAIKSFVSSTTNNMTYGTLDGLPTAFQQQDMETAARLGVSVDMLGDEIKQSNRDLGKAVHEAMKTGAISALTNLPGHLALHGITSFAHTIKQHIQIAKENQKAVVQNTTKPQIENSAAVGSSNDSDVTNNRVFRADAGHDTLNGPHPSGAPTDLVYSSNSLYPPNPVKVEQSTISEANSRSERSPVSSTDGRKIRIDGNNNILHGPHDLPNANQTVLPRTATTESKQASRGNSHLVMSGEREANKPGSTEGQKSSHAGEQKDITTTNDRTSNKMPSEEPRAGSSNENVIEGSNPPSITLDEDVRIKNNIEQVSPEQDRSKRLDMLINQTVPDHEDRLQLCKDILRLDNSVAIRTETELSTAPIVKALKYLIEDGYKDYSKLSELEEVDVLAVNTLEKFTKSELETQEVQECIALLQEKWSTIGHKQAFEHSVSPLITGHTLEAMVTELHDIKWSDGNQLIKLKEEYKNLSKHIDNLYEQHDDNFMTIASEYLKQKMGPEKFKEIEDKGNEEILELVDQELGMRWADNEQVGVLLQNNPELLKIYHELRTSESKVEQLGAEINNIRSQRLETITSTLQKFSQKVGLPKALEVTSAGVLNCAGKYIEGKITLNNKILDSDHLNVPELISIVAHEYQHYEQDVLVIKHIVDKIAKELNQKIGIATSFDTRAKIMELYTAETDGYQLSAKLLDQVLEIRNGVELEPREKVRADNLIASHVDLKNEESWQRGMRISRLNSACVTIKSGELERIKSNSHDVKSVRELLREEGKLSRDMDGDLEQLEKIIKMPDASDQELLQPICNRLSSEISAILIELKSKGYAEYRERIHEIEAHIVTSRALGFQKYILKNNNEETQSTEASSLSQSNISQQQQPLPAPDPKDRPIRYMRPLSPDEEPGIRTTGAEKPGSSPEHAHSIEQNEQNTLVRQTNSTATSNAQTELVIPPQPDHLPILEQVPIDQSKILDFHKSCNEHINALERRTALEEDISGCIRGSYGKTGDDYQSWRNTTKLYEQELADLNKQIASQRQKLYDKAALLSDQERAEINRASIETSLEEQKRLVAEHVAKVDRGEAGERPTVPDIEKRDQAVRRQTIVHDILSGPRAKPIDSSINAAQNPDARLKDRLIDIDRQRTNLMERRIVLERDLKDLEVRNRLARMWNKDKIEQCKQQIAELKTKHTDFSTLENNLYQDAIANAKPGQALVIGQQGDIPLVGDFRSKHAQLMRCDDGTYLLRDGTDGKPSSFLREDYNDLTGRSEPTKPDDYGTFVKRVAPDGTISYKTVSSKIPTIVKPGDEIYLGYRPDPNKDFVSGSYGRCRLVIPELKKTVADILNKRLGQDANSNAPIKLERTLGAPGADEAKPASKVPPPDPKDKPIRYMRPLSPDEEPGARTSGADLPIRQEKLENLGETISGDELAKGIMPGEKPTSRTIEQVRENASCIADIMLTDQEFRLSVIEEVNRRMDWSEVPRLAISGENSHAFEELSARLKDKLTGVFMDVLRTKLSEHKLELSDCMKRTSIGVRNRTKKGHDTPDSKAIAQNSPLHGLSLPVLALDKDHCIVIAKSKPTRKQNADTISPRLRVRADLLQNDRRHEGLYKIYQDMLALAQTESRNASLPYEELKAQAEHDNTARLNMYLKDRDLLEQIVSREKGQKQSTIAQPIQTMRDAFRQGLMEAVYEHLKREPSPERLSLEHADRIYRRSGSSMLITEGNTSISLGSTKPLLLDVIQKMMGQQSDTPSGRVLRDLECLVKTNKMPRRLEQYRDFEGANKGAPLEPITRDAMEGLVNRALDITLKKHIANNFGHLDPHKLASVIQNWTTQGDRILTQTPEGQSPGTPDRNEVRSGSDVPPPDPKDKPIRYMRPLSPDEEFGLSGRADSDNIPTKDPANVDGNKEGKIIGLANTSKDRIVETSPSVRDDAKRPREQLMKIMQERLEIAHELGMGGIRRTLEDLESGNLLNRRWNQREIIRLKTQITELEKKYVDLGRQHDQLITDAITGIKPDHTAIIGANGDIPVFGNFLARHAQLKRLDSKTYSLLDGIDGKPSSSRIIGNPLSSHDYGTYIKRISSSGEIKYETVSATKPTIVKSGDEIYIGYRPDKPNEGMWNQEKFVIPPDPKDRPIRYMRPSSPNEEFSSATGGAAPNSAVSLAELTKFSTQQLDKILCTGKITDEQFLGVLTSNHWNALSKEAILSITTPERIEKITPERLFALKQEQLWAIFDGLADAQFNAVLAPLTQTEKATLLEKLGIKPIAGGAPGERIVNTIALNDEERRMLPEALATKYNVSTEVAKHALHTGELPVRQAAKSDEVEIVLTPEDLRTSHIDLAKKYGIAINTARKALDRGSFKHVLPKNRIELTEEQMHMSAIDLARGLGISRTTAEGALKKGFYAQKNVSVADKVELTEEQKNMTAADLAKELGIKISTAERALKKGFYAQQNVSQANRVELTEEQKQMTPMDLARDAGITRSTAERALKKGFYAQQNVSQANRVELTEEQKQMTAADLARELGIHRETAVNALKKGFYVQKNVSVADKVELTEEQKNMAAIDLARELGITRRTAEGALKKGFYAQQNVSQANRVELTEEQKNMTAADLAKELGIKTSTAERALKKGFYVQQNVSETNTVELTEEQKNMAAIDLARELGITRRTAEGALKKGFYAQRNVSQANRVELTEEQKHMTAADLAKELGIHRETAVNALKKGFYVQKNISVTDKVELTEEQKNMAVADLAKELGINISTAERALKKGFYSQQNVSQTNKVELTEEQMLMTPVDLASELGITRKTAERALKKGFYAQQNVSQTNRVELTEEQMLMTALDLARELGIKTSTAEGALKKGFYVLKNVSVGDKVELTEKQKSMTAVDLAKELGINKRTAERALKKGFYAQQNVSQTNRVELTEEQKLMTALDLARQLGIDRSTADRALNKGFYMQQTVSERNKVELTEEQKLMTALDLAKELGVKITKAQRALKNGYYVQQILSQANRVELTEEQKNMTPMDLARNAGITRSTAENALKKGFYVLKDISETNKVELTEEQKRMSAADLARATGIARNTADRALKKGFYVRQNIPETNKIELTEEQKQMTPMDLARDAGIARDTAERTLKKGFYVRQDLSKASRVELTEEQKQMTPMDLARDAGITRGTAERALENGYYRRIEISEINKVRLTEEQKRMSAEELGRMLGIKEDIAARALSKGHLMRRQKSLITIPETSRNKLTQRLGVTNDEATDVVPYIKIAAKRADIELDNYGALVCLAVMKARGVSKTGLTASQVISDHAKDSQAVRQILRLNEDINISQALDVFTLKMLLSNPVSGKTNVSLDRAVSRIEFSDPTSKEKVRQDLTKHVEDLIDKAERDERTDDAERLYPIMLAVDDKTYNESPEGQALINLVQAQSSVCWQSALIGNDLGSLPQTQLARVIRSVTLERLESLPSNEARQELRQRLHLAALTCAQGEQSPHGRSAFVKAWIDNARGMSLEGKQEACLAIALTCSPGDLRNLDSREFPANRDFKLLADSLHAMHKSRLDERQTANLVMKFIKEADHRRSLPDSVITDLFQELVAHRPYDRRPDMTKPWPIEKLSKNDLVWLRDCLSRKLASKDTITALPSTENYAIEIARKLDNKPLEPQYLEKLMGKYRDTRERALAFQLLSERATYLSADGWYQQLRSAADGMRKADFVTIEKLPGQGTRFTESITAVCLAGDTAGRASAYEFRKQTGIKVEILELDSRENLPTERKLVLFSDPQKLSNSSPLYKVLTESPNIYKPDAILQFDRGINYLDLASRRVNPSQIEAKFDQMLESEISKGKSDIKEVKPQILAMYGSNDEAKYLQSAIERANDQSNARRAVRAMIYFDQALAKNRELTGRASAQLIAHIMANTVEILNHQHMTEDAGRLHSQIISGQAGKPPVQIENMVFIRGTASLPGTERLYRTDSSDYVTHIYRLANGLDGKEFDHQFVTLDRALRMKENEFSGKTFVFLNDVHYSGEQGSKLIEGVPNGAESKLGGLGRLAKLVNGKAEVVFGTLGGYEEGLSIVRSAAANHGMRVENVRTYQNAYDLARLVVERSLTGSADNAPDEFRLTGVAGVAQLLAGSENTTGSTTVEPNQIGQQILGRPQIEHLGQRVVSALFLPHMRSNLTARNVDRLADFLNLPRSHNESKPVVVPDTAPTYRVIMEDTLNYYRGGITTSEDLAFVLGEGLAKFISENPDGVFDNTNILAKPIEIEFGNEPFEQNQPNRLVIRLGHQYSDPTNLQAAQEAVFSQLMRLRSQDRSPN